MADHQVPATKLWRESDDDGFLIVLECVCGQAVDYPGHPDDRARVVCEGCGQTWSIPGAPALDDVTAVPPSALRYEELKARSLMPENPTIVAVQVLEGAQRDETLDEYVRGIAASWIKRLVDSEGNPLDDRLRTIPQHVSMENALAARGTLTTLLAEDDRVRFEVEVLRTVLDRTSAVDLTALLAEHLGSYAPHIVAAMQLSLDEATATAAASAPQLDGSYEPWKPNGE